MKYEKKDKRKKNAETRKNARKRFVKQAKGGVEYSEKGGNE